MTKKTLIKKHFAVYRDGALLIRTKTKPTAEEVVKNFGHTGKEFDIKEEEIVTPWLYAKTGGRFGYTTDLI